jgi:hypothetical protein
MAVFAVVSLNRSKQRPRVKVLRGSVEPVVQANSRDVPVLIDVRIVTRSRAPGAGYDGDIQRVGLLPLLMWSKMFLHSPEKLLDRLARAPIF